MRGCLRSTLKLVEPSNKAVRIISRSAKVRIVKRSKFACSDPVRPPVPSTLPKADIKWVELLRRYGRAKSAVGNYSCGVQFDRGRRGGNVRKIEFPCRQSRLRRRGANIAHTAPARALARPAIIASTRPATLPKLLLKSLSFESRQSKKKFSASAQVI